MGWKGLTNFVRIGAKTSLHLVESPAVADSPPCALQIGAKIPVELADNTQSSFTILSIGDGSAFIQALDGTVWLMTPHSEHDFPMSFQSSPNLNSQNWVIRSQVHPAGPE
ncbi:MAG: hypothetical protein ABSA13_08820 [Beijerinckiaceae bacterium]|jgi:hypothetical protein